jgi:hypothetical protein
MMSCASNGLWFKSTEHVVLVVDELIRHRHIIEIFVT